MPLSDDQRALLRLLAQREQGYEDIAALKGMSVREVREEVNAALAALDAPAQEPAPQPPPEPEPAPPATEPEQATAASAPSPPVAGATTRPTRPSRPALPAQRRRLILLTGGALGVVAVVLLAIALIGGGGSDSTSATSGSDTEVAAAENGKVTQALLTAADGSDASGQAIFGRVGREEVVLQVTAENLQPTEQGESYTVWLYRTPKLSLRVGSVAVGEEGRLGARFAIPAELLAYVASGAFDQIYVSRTSNADYQREVAKAKANKTLPRYTGETVMTGKITGPIAKK